MTTSGKFISFEGIDGAGKTTHIHALAQAFRGQGRAVALTREPGGTILAEQLRTLVLHEDMDTLTEVLLMFAIRRDHLMRVIEPALARGEFVLCDRFTDATFAYQGFGRGFDLEILSFLEQTVQAVPALGEDSSVNHVRHPDLTLWFDLSPIDAAARLTDGRVLDRFESEPVEFFTQVAQGYQQRLNSHPERIVRVCADQPLEAVWQNVLTVIQQRGWL